MRVAIASDHGGFNLKGQLVAALSELGHEVLDLGPATAAAVDYPDTARPLGAVVVERRADLGVLVCGSGIGMSIAVNKLKGVRAALCHTELEGRLARQHNDANVLCLGERIIGPTLARAILEAFLTAKFEGGRHATRVAKIEP
jgi:ribose 5-phosphate isomerase B